jgi:hypothetical protein
MPDERYAICKEAAVYDVRQGVYHDRWERIGSIPLDLVEALKGATPEQMQEAADYILCSQAGLHALNCLDSTPGAEEWAASADLLDGWGGTCGLALHALRESIEGAKP